jgi:LDH2 family malate/lactate/ureidoglycolate dehydrogenase
LSLLPHTHAQGYSWATVVELLSTAFQSGPFGAAISGVDQKTGKPAPMALGNYFLAIDIEALVDINVFKQNAGNLLRFIRGSTKDPRGALVVNLLCLAIL